MWRDLSMTSLDITRIIPISPENFWICWVLPRYFCWDLADIGTWILWSKWSPKTGLHPNKHTQNNSKGISKLTHLPRGQSPFSREMDRCWSPNIRITCSHRRNTRISSRPLHPSIRIFIPPRPRSCTTTKRTDFRYGCCARWKDNLHLPINAKHGRDLCKW